MLLSWRQMLPRLSSPQAWYWLAIPSHDMNIMLPIDLPSAVTTLHVAAFHVGHSAGRSGLRHAPHCCPRSQES